MDVSSDDGSGLSEATFGLGTWQWGDQLFWGYGNGYQENDLFELFKYCISQNMRFFDTAEVYGSGRSEQLLGKFIRELGEPVYVATKFMPYPWRLSRRSLLKSLKASLTRLGLQKVNLYQMHWPLPPVTVEAWMEGMIEAVQNGLTGAVGVSNYDKRQMLTAHNALTRQGVPLASNQVEYHLLNRKIELNGLMEECNQLGVKVIAYSPLAQGLLTGKYTPDNPPRGVRGGRAAKRLLVKIQPLLRAMRRIGADHAGKTPAQVAINWVICKGAIPIPGAKNLNQAEQNLGAMGWTLTEAEMAELDELSLAVHKDS